MVQSVRRIETTLTAKRKHAYREGLRNFAVGFLLPSAGQDARQQAVDDLTVKIFVQGEVKRWWAKERARKAARRARIKVWLG